MSVPMTPDRLAEIRERLASTLAPRKAEVAELLAEVDRLNARVGWYHGELTGSNLTAWETEQENGLLRTALEAAGREPQWAARVRLAWESARRGRRDEQDLRELAEASRERWRAATLEAEAERDALRARLAELDALKLGAVDGRMSATCRDPQHPTWLRAAKDTRECPWCRVAELERTAVLAEEDYRRVVRGACQIESQLRARIEELVAQRDDALVELVTGQAPPEALSPWERAVAGLNALVDADVIFHVEPDGHISAPFSDEHIEWDLRARRWVLTHDDEAEDPHDSPLRPGACDACGDVPEKWCPDCAACRQGCHGGNDGNPCTHARAPWGGVS
ncbi:hypothetical protein [Streptomyces sp. NPDC001282]|uniref:hypothetical protein n=1 Tax=Streptomyces sp. NPDC001282 TaxID=3364557 RepID=UPI00367D9E6C